MTTPRLHTIAAALGLIVASGRSVRANPPPHGCGFGECGTNSADIRGTAINGINLAGLAGPDNVRLIVGSLKLTPNPATMPPICSTQSASFDLAVDGGALVAKTSAGLELPTECLLDSTFTLSLPVTAPDGAVTQTLVNLRIARHDTVSTWHMTLAPALLQTYEIIDIEKGLPVCTPTGWMETWQTGGLNVDLGNPPSAPGQQWHVPTDHAVIVQGETYTAAASVDANHSGANWFNIACAGSALAKSRLMGYDPMAATSTAGQRQSTLKMLTAHYVRDNTQSWTQTGTPLIWVSNPPVAYYGGADPALARGPIEAYWDANGTTCISHLRLWNHNQPPHLGPESTTLLTIRRLGNLGACATGGIDGRPPAGTLWTTTTVDHID